MQRDEENTKKFLRTPRKGDKVKVYPNASNESPRYGVVDFVKEDELEREIVVLDESFEPFSLEECNYCLEKRKVEFKRPEDEFQQRKIRRYKM